MLSQAAGVLCGIIGVRLATQLVPPALYGEFGVFLSFITLGPWVVHAGLIRYVSRNWATATERAAAAASLATLAFRRLPWLLVASGAAALSFSVWTWPSATALLFATTAFLSFGGLAQAALQAERRHWRDLAVNLTVSTTRTFLPLLLFAATGAAVALPAGLLLSALSFAAIALIGLGVVPRGTGDRPALAGSFTGPLFPLVALSGWATSGATRWVAAGILPADEVGYFVLANSVGTLLPGVLVAISIQYVQPAWFSRPHSTQDDRRALLRHVDQAAAVFGVAALSAITILQLVAPWLVGPLIHPDFQSALSYLFPAGCFAIATATTVFYQSLLLAVRREDRIGAIEAAFALGLVGTGVCAGWAGSEWFSLWLLTSPVWPWFLYRTLVRHALLTPA